MHISLHLLFIKKNRLFLLLFSIYIYIHIKEFIEKDRNVENRYHTNNQIE